MRAWKSRLRRTVVALGYSVHRWPVNRFDGMLDALSLLRGRGYAPRVVMDCGANRGEWTRIARSLFPEAAFYLVEPQPACTSRLRNLAAGIPGLTVHAVAVTEPGVVRVRMVGGGHVGGGTGAWVARAGETTPGEVEVDCPATTLDALFARSVTREDRPLLKLDLEGHELCALSGGTQLLAAVEIVLTELQFFQIADHGRPMFADVVEFLGARGFDLYDVACLSQRPRDLRLRQGDVIFARRDSALLADRSWE